jgi:CRISPR/Cas system-associated protein Csm6
MNKQELFEKNLVLTAEFSRYVLEHPEVAKRIPKDAIVVILPEYDQELAEENLRIARARREKAQPMVLVRVKRLAQVRKSRLVKPKVELVFD